MTTTSAATAPMTKLQAALARVRAQHNPAITTPEAASIATPLSTFISIYNKAGKDCYIDYMHGAKALYKYLSPIEIPDIDPKLLVSCNLSAGCLSGYSIEQLAILVATTPTTPAIHNPQFDYIKRLVVYYTARQLLQGDI